MVEQFCNVGVAAVQDSECLRHSRPYPPELGGWMQMIHLKSNADASEALVLKLALIYDGEVISMRVASGHTTAASNIFLRNS